MKNEKNKKLIHVGWLALILVSIVLFTENIMSSTEIYNFSYLLTNSPPLTDFVSRIVIIYIIGALVIKRKPEEKTENE